MEDTPPQIHVPTVQFDPPPEKKHILTNKLQFIKKSIIPALIKHHLSWPFKKPVDVVGLRLLDYYTVVKNPMDISSLCKRLNHGWYSSADECVADFNLIINNCLAYNSPNEDVSRMAEVLRRFFHEKLLKMPKTEFVLTPGKKRDSFVPGSFNKTPSTKPPKRVKGLGTLQKRCFAVICELFDSRYADFMSDLYEWKEGGNTLTQVRDQVQNMGYNTFDQFVTDVRAIINAAVPVFPSSADKFHVLFEETLVNVGLGHSREDGLERNVASLAERVEKLEGQVNLLKKITSNPCPPSRHTPKSAESPKKRTLTPSAKSITPQTPPTEEEGYSYDEKRKLSSTVTTRLPTEELIRVIQMVKDREPTAGKLSDTGEFVFDFEKLKTSTIRLIEQHTNDYLRRAEKNLTSGGNKRKYSDKLKPETIVERKLELERVLGNVRDILAPNAKKPRVVDTDKTAADRQRIERLSDESSWSSNFESESDGMDLS